MLTNTNNSSYSSYKITKKYTLKFTIKVPTQTLEENNYKYHSKSL